MAEPGFVPFVPRRLGVAVEPARTTANETNVAVELARPARSDGAAESTRPGAAGTHKGAVELALPAAPPPTEEIEACGSAVDAMGAGERLEQEQPRESDEQPRKSAGPELPACSHARQIRHEAIRLAAMACGRALRHAIVLHPRIIAGLVDDAIAAAGNPEHARIRLHPDAVAAISSPDHDCISDETLGVGDVVVELDGSSVGASMDTFAELLARAGAEV